MSCHVIMAYTDHFHCSCCHCPMSAEQTRSLWASSSTPRFPFQGQGKQPDPPGSSQQLFAFCPGFTGGRTDTTGLKSCDTLLLIPVPLCHDGFGEGSRETDQRPEAEKRGDAPTRLPVSSVSSVLGAPGQAVQPKERFRRR